MRKPIDSQRTDPVGQLQADPAFTLPFHAHDDEPLLFGGTTVLQDVSDGLFNRGQDNVAADEKIVDRTGRHPVNIADSINGTR